ncbi:hypothetical protein F5051DRAFT_433701 [Lentinula edodes]|nr:hypothetical protein F5051DRAFT_433701 [Lentinula edodes]
MYMALSSKYKCILKYLLTRLERKSPTSVLKTGLLRIVNGTSIDRQKRGSGYSEFHSGRQYDGLTVQALRICAGLTFILFCTHLICLISLANVHRLEIICPVDPLPDYEKSSADEFCKSSLLRMDLAGYTRMSIGKRYGKSGCRVVLRDARNSGTRIVLVQRGFGFLQFELRIDVERNPSPKAYREVLFRWPLERCLEDDRPSNASKGRNLLKKDLYLQLWLVVIRYGLRQPQQYTVIFMWSFGMATTPSIKSTQRSTNGSSLGRYNVVINVSSMSDSLLTISQPVPAVLYLEQKARQSFGGNKGIHFRGTK